MLARSMPPRLRGFGSFDQVFQQGLHFFEFPFQVRYEAGEQPLRIGFSVPKRRFKRAVDRNLLRRRMKEAYRLHRSDWESQAGGGAVVLVYSTNEILDYQRLSGSLRKAMKRWAQERGVTSKEPGPQA
ncbi:MAG: ribonuclease P protein component [Bacteroidia bacterium]|jgi:ribonuclease P protein component